MPRHKIQPHERGHRKRLSENEPTRPYSIKVPQSLRERLDAAGPQRVRDHLDTLDE